MAGVGAFDGVGAEKENGARNRGSARRVARRPAPQSAGPRRRPRGRRRKPSAAQRKAGGEDDEDDDRREARAQDPHLIRKESKKKSQERSRSFSAASSIGARCSACGRVIAGVGVIIWVGAHLPPIQSLAVPKRPPTIQIAGMDGSILATRGEMAGAKSR